MSTNRTDPKPIWGAKNIAERIGITERAAFNMLSRGQLPAKRVGGRWVAHIDELDQFFRSGSPKDEKKTLHVGLCRQL